MKCSFSERRENGWHATDTEDFSSDFDSFFPIVLTSVRDKLNTMTKCVHLHFYCYLALSRTTSLLENWKAGDNSS